VPDRAAVRLQAADAHPPTGRQQDGLGIGVQGAAAQRAGHHRAAAPDGEHPVDRQAGAAPVGRLGHPVEGAVELLAQAVEAQPGGCRGLHHDRPGQGGARQPVADLPGHLGDAVRADQVYLAQGDHPGGDPEQVEDGQVLGRLGLPALGGVDHQQGAVNPADAGQHVVYEPLVAGDVDEADLAP
jgi:hypothetical protein